MDLSKIGMNARKAFLASAACSPMQRVKAVNRIAAGLEVDRAAIRAANERDISAALEAGLTPALVDRLTLTDRRLDAMAADLRRLAELPDLLGETIEARTLPNGLRVRKVRVPLGVMGVIYESRPNVTIDIAALGVKTGNAAILRGGKETIRTNRALMEIVRGAVRAAGLPEHTVQFIDDPDRALVEALLRLNRYVDFIVPRGGNALHEFCRERATIPVITGGIGICHLFVDETADRPASLRLIHNAKTQRPSVCNALDTLLVHERIAAEFLPQVVEALTPAGVSFRADPGAAAFAAGEAVFPAGPDDFDTEWLSLVLGLKVVMGLEEAVEHIARHSTHHSDGILTADAGNAARFVQAVDSAAVFVNASTRFNDGAQLGLGAEVAVSTQRLHARGPMGLPELTTYKWVVEGDYTVRD
ncbi:MAG TPA: glutamate-5-semialdehyde dehydrogenase [Anaerolineales bacterium]|nr:glutamate-5-semialdehyde dehydrogenase [Anaerolineales bacterium]